MHDDIYPLHPKRRVSEPRAFEEEIFEAYSKLDDACIENALLLNRELATYDPDLDERCGLLADRFEVYAMKIGQCPGHRLAVSLDHGARNGPTVMSHGPVAAKHACDGARRLVTLHRKLIDPSWER